MYSDISKIIFPVKSYIICKCPRYKWCVLFGECNKMVSIVIQINMIHTYPIYSYALLICSGIHTC